MFVRVQSNEIFPWMPYNRHTRGLIIGRKMPHASLIITASELVVLSLLILLFELVLLFSF